MNRVTYMNRSYDKVETTRIRGIVKCFSFLLVLLPILNQISLFGYGFLEFFSIFFAIAVLMTFRYKIKINPLLVFYLYMMISAAISSLIYGDGITNAILSLSRLLMIYIGVFVGVQKFFNYEFSKKLYVKVVTVLSVLIFIQCAAYYIFDLQLYYVPSNVILNYGGGMNSSVLIESWTRSVNGGYIYRPSSIFIEPAYFAYYSIPAVVLLLFDRSRLGKKELYLALFISIAAILTTSTMSFVVVVLVWVAFVIFGKNGLTKRMRNTITIFSVLLLVSFLIVVNQSAVEFSLLRKVDQFMDLQSSSSTSMRLVRGLMFFGYMSFFTKIFGCGFGHLSDYYEYGSIGRYMDYTIAQTGYMNSASGILCSLGIVGFVIFIVFIIKPLRMRNTTTKYMALLLITFMLGGAIMDTGFFYLIMAFTLIGRSSPGNNMIVR